MQPADPLAAVPDPQSLRRLIAENVQRTQHLRRLLRLALQMSQQNTTTPRTGAAQPEAVAHVG